MNSLNEFGLLQSEIDNNMVFVVDLKTNKIEFASKLAHLNLGYGRSELMDLRANDLHPDEMEEMASFINLVNEKEEVSTSSLHCVTKSGEVLSSNIFGRITVLNGKKYLVATVVLSKNR